jgi:hypothetical protein
MPEHRYDEKDEPAVRQATRHKNEHLIDHACPFCGERRVKISAGDIPADRYRVELYCDNMYCDVREFTVIPLRMNGPVARVRTDVAALDAIDDGSDEEQAEEASEFLRDPNGRVVGNIYSLGADDLAYQDAAKLHRRQRSRRIRIEPPE